MSHCLWFYKPGLPPPKKTKQNNTKKIKIFQAWKIILIMFLFIFMILINFFLLLVLFVINRNTFQRCWLSLESFSDHQNLSPNWAMWRESWITYRSEYTCWKCRLMTYRLFKRGMTLAWYVLLILLLPQCL